MNAPRKQYPPEPAAPAKRGNFLNQTANYQLNQWDPADRILRTDFNSDNEKIDAALKTSADAIAAETAARESAVSAVSGRAGLQLIREGSITEDANTINLQLTDIDWSQWRAVHLYVEPYTSTTSKTFSATWGSNSSYSFGSMSGNRAGEAPENLLHIILFPLYQSQRYICAISMGVSSPGFVEFSSRFGADKYIRLSYTDTTYLFQAGTIYKIWGEK